MILWAFTDFIETKSKLLVLKRPLVYLTIWYGFCSLSKAVQCPIDDYNTVL